MLKQISFILIFDLLFCFTAFADEVTLQNGNTMIWDSYYEEGNSYCTSKAGGIVCFNKKDIKSIKEEVLSENTKVVENRMSSSSGSYAPKAGKCKNYYYLDPNTGWEKYIDDDCKVREYHTCNHIKGSSAELQRCVEDRKKEKEDDSRMAREQNRANQERLRKEQDAKMDEYNRQWKAKTDAAWQEFKNRRY